MFVKRVNDYVRFYLFILQSGWRTIPC